MTAEEVFSIYMINMVRSLTDTCCLFPTKRSLKSIYENTNSSIFISVKQRRVY